MLPSLITAELVQKGCGLLRQYLSPRHMRKSEREEGVGVGVGVTRQSYMYNRAIVICYEQLIKGH